MHRSLFDLTSSRLCRMGLPQDKEDAKAPEPPETPTWPLRAATAASRREAPPRPHTRTLGPLSTVIGLLLLAVAGRIEVRTCLGTCSEARATEQASCCSAGDEAPTHEASCCGCCDDEGPGESRALPAGRAAG